MLLKTEDLKKRLGVSREVALRLMRSESFPSMRLGNRYYVDEDKLREWISKSAHKSIAI